MSDRLATLLYLRALGLEECVVGSTLAEFKANPYVVETVRLIRETGPIPVPVGTTIDGREHTPVLHTSEFYFEREETISSFYVDMVAHPLDPPFVVPQSGHYAIGVVDGKAVIRRIT